MSPPHGHHPGSLIAPQGMADRIIALKKADLALRDRLARSGRLGQGYDRDMAALHNRHAEVLNDIIEAIGYPTVDKVGQEAGEAAWLVIQHAIGKPGFMKRCAELLAQAVDENKADSRHLAYLVDRIAFFEGRPQRFGTQFDWDEAGELTPCAVDAAIHVNQRRQAIGLNTLEEQTAIARQQAKNENQAPPTHWHERKQAFDAWRKATGWIK